jgi:hypothetical protein
MRFVLAFLLVFGGEVLGGNLDRIRKALSKQEYEKASELIIKGLSKEPENPGLFFFSATLRFIPSYSEYNLDSARVYSEKAKVLFSNLTAEDIEDLQEDGVTIEKIDTLYFQIREASFLKLNENLTVEGAERFMRIFPNSPFEDRLIFQRDSIVFDQVKRNDELGVYEDFLKRYSTTEFREVAIERIDELRYQVLTHTGDLKDYYSFLKNHPDTKFKNEIEEFIFVVSTVNHTPKVYNDFIQFASNEKLRKKAADLLYYVSLDLGVYHNHPNRDSIEQVESLADLTLIAVSDDGKFGFHDQYGFQKIPYQFEDVDYIYKCELTKNDWLLVKGKRGNMVIDKKGSVVIPSLDGFEDLSSGLVLVSHKEDKYLYHKSGSKILNEPVEDARLLANRWIALKTKKKWGMISFSGYEIAKPEFDDIRIEGNFWIFEKDRQIAVYNEELVEEELIDSGLDLEFKFDDLELLSDNRLIGFRDTRECMINDGLEFLIPWGEYEINPDESGWYLKTDQGYRLYDSNRSDIMNQVHPYLETNMGWLGVMTVQDWMLLPRKGLQPSRNYDSLKLINEHAVFLQKGDTSELLFSNGYRIPFDFLAARTFFNHPDYLLLEEDDKKSVVDSTGATLLSGSFDEITFFNDSLLLVKREKKNGLIKLDSTYQVELKFDALDEQDGLILCLQEGKIGCFDLINDITLSTEYEARIERLGNDYLVKKESKLGVVDSIENEVLPFSYDEIKFWNDTSFLVRDGENWNIVNRNGDEILEEPISFVSLLLQMDNHTIWKFVSDGKYGLLSNENGEIAGPEFTDIFNIGSKKEPIFFADQHLNKAGFHVVSYLDDTGELLLSKAYTLEEFDSILCDN